MVNVGKYTIHGSLWEILIDTPLNHDSTHMYDDLSPLQPVYHYDVIETLGLAPKIVPCQAPPIDPRTQNGHLLK